MALTFKKLFAPQLLAGASATVFTMDATPSTLLLRNCRVRLTNIDTVAHAVTLYAVPSAGSASTTNEFLPAVSVPANGYLDVDVPEMTASDFLAGFADTANKVNIQVMDGVLQS